MTVIMTSRKELSRLQILIGLADGRTRADDAAALMGMGRREVYRLLDEFRTRGAEALVSKRRGKSSNHAHGAVVRMTVLGIVRERYEDFDPTLAAEKLPEVHGSQLASRRCASGRSKTASGSAGATRSSASTSRAIAAIASVTWSRLMAASTGGSRIAVRNARCWCSWTTPPVG